jgi:spore maturation protein CgeB
VTFHDVASGAQPPPAENVNVVILGLSITSSWGNGHATNYRALQRALTEAGHQVLFIERDVPWYAAERDLPVPPCGRTELYQSLEELDARFASAVRDADLVIVGSYVPQGIMVARWVTAIATGVTAFYDINTPVTVAALERGVCEYLEPDLIGAFDLYLSFSAGPILERLRSSFGARRACAFHCLVDPDLYRPLHGDVRWDLGYLGTYSEDRQPSLDRLLIEPARRRPDLRFVVAGPQYPAEVEWPANVERIEHLAPADHPQFYAAQTATLNVTRADMVQAGWSPSVRLFEAAACAVPVISDPWAGIETFFVPGSEILIAEDPIAVLEALEQLTDRGRRAAMGRAARHRVVPAHTARQRAAELIALAHDCRKDALRR